MAGMVYQLKITIMEIEPPIWRRVLVPENISFLKLHKIMQVAFGWQNYHLFSLDFKDTVVAIPDLNYAPGELYGDVTELNAKSTKIEGLFGERKACLYL